MRVDRLGPYRILEELGRGGMGRVYLAAVSGKAPGLEPGARVALKVIHPHLLETPGFFKRFLREAQIGRSVRHPNVVRCHDCDALTTAEGQQHFLVMEYVAGQTLRDLALDLGRVPEQLCRHIALEISKGLEAIHAAGALHRDLKPENVLITEDHVVKVMDLGVARLQDESVRLSQTGAFVGSLEYASPEQFRGRDSPAGARSDLHALGLLLYELSTGHHPFRDEDPSAVMRRVLEEEPSKAGVLNPQLSPFFEELLDKLLQKDPAARFASATELVHVLSAGEGSTWWTERVASLRATTHRPLRRIRIPRETSLYGRGEELALLRSAYDAAVAGEGRVLLIEGEAGIGKTRLVDEFVALLDAEGEDLNFLFGSYPPGGAATASGAFSTAYRQQFGVQGLEETLASYLPETPVLVPAFAALLRGESVPTGQESLTQESLQTVFVLATRALARERPTIVLIDDLHFAPEAGRALFVSLALTAPGHRFLLIGTTRHGLPREWVSSVSRLSHAGHVHLQRLGPKDLAQLLEDAFRSKRLAEELSHRIAVKSDGNPFFAFEIIRGLREGQFIAQGPDGTWVSTQVIRDIQVPSSVSDLVQARLAGLDDREKNLLDVAACCGFEFDPLLAAAVLAQPEIPAMQRLARIEHRHRLVRSVGRRCVFDHHQVQEALYGGLPELLRERYHGAIADALVSRHEAARDGEALPGAFCVEVCEHYLAAGRGGDALPHLDAALGHLQEGYLNDQVIKLADRALSVDGLLTGAERVRILLRQEDRLHLLGRREEQRAVLGEAACLAQDLSDEHLLAHIGRRRSRLDLALGRFTQALDGFLRDAERAGALGDHEPEMYASANRGLVLMRLGRMPEARVVLERVLSLAQAHAYRSGEASATRLLGDHAKQLGRFDEALALHRRALDLVRETGDLHGEANCVGSLGTLHSAMGRMDEARELYERWQSLARAIGDRQGEAAAIGNLGIVFLTQGRVDEARERFERHLDLAREYGDQQGELNAMANLGLVADARGHYEAARVWNERALQLAHDIRSREAEKVILGNLGGILSMLGRFDEARAHLSRSLELALELEDPRTQTQALAGLAQVAEAVDDVPEARRRVEAALRLCREQGDTVRTANVLAILGRLLVEHGEPHEAEQRLVEAARLAEETGSPEAIVRALVLRASLAGGDVAAAEAALGTYGDRLEVATRLDARFRLWEASGREEHRVEARRLLNGVLHEMPEGEREVLAGNVALFRKILAS